MFFVGQHTPGVHHFKESALPLSARVQAITRNAGFVTDESFSNAEDAVEKRGFADIGSPDDGDAWSLRLSAESRHTHPILTGERVVCFEASRNVRLNRTDWQLGFCKS